MPGNSLQLVTGGGDAPRAAIAATSDVPLWSMPEYSGPDMATVLVKLGNVSCYVSSVYLDIKHVGTRFFPNTLVPLLSHCRQKHKSLIIGMDSNAQCHVGP